MSTANDRQVTGSAHPLLHITEQNYVDSPLLRLSGELRNMIFGHLLGGKTWTMKSARPHAFADLQDALQISRVCRQIYAEEPAYNAFAKSSFAVGHQGAFKNWLNARPVRYVEAITSITWVCHATALHFHQGHWAVFPNEHEAFGHKKLPPLNILSALKSVKVFGLVVLIHGDQTMPPLDSIHDQIQKWIQHKLHLVSERDLDVELSHGYRILTGHDGREWYELI
ncbi:hypothetical protein N0V94_007527 [Neodidymelliopsis sp. IMI 364377]|nr:hypothetical protein N0V94_007527 [Neodidymelliopsis sp. IMI 364377]